MKTARAILAAVALAASAGCTLPQEALLDWTSAATATVATNALPASGGWWTATGSEAENGGE